MTSTLHAHCPEIECEGCANSIQRSLGKLSGIQKIDVDVQSKDVTVEYDPAQLSEATISERLERAGFPPERAA